MTDECERCEDGEGDVYAAVGDVERYVCPECREELLDVLVDASGGEGGR